MGASVGFQVAGCNCLRDITVTLRKVFPLKLSNYCRKDSFSIYDYRIHFIALSFRYFSHFNRIL